MRADLDQQTTQVSVTYMSIVLKTVHDDPVMSVLGVRKTFYLGSREIGIIVLHEVLKRFSVY